MDPKVHYRVHPTLNQLNHVETLIPLTYVLMFFHTRLGLPVDLFTTDFRLKFLVHVLFLSCMLLA